jgi:hypothetical protein
LGPAQTKLFLPVNVFSKQISKPNYATDENSSTKI